jgi:hypothetical protein
LDTVHFMKKFFTEFQIDNHKRLWWYYVFLPRRLWVIKHNKIYIL